MEIKMNQYFQGSADVSQEYRPTSAAGPQQTASAAVSGNLADLVKNATVYRVQQAWPRVVYAPETSGQGKVERLY